LIRNIMMAALYVHDHVVHFYHLHSLDWVDIVNALKADPKKAAELAALFCWSHWKMRTHRADPLRARSRAFRAIIRPRSLPTTSE
jgi:Ni,Fe-hydrogenase I large subunit